MPRDGSAPHPESFPRELVDDPATAQALAGAIIVDAQVAVTILDAECNFLYVSQALKDHLGWKAQDIVGHRLDEMLPGPEGAERCEVVRRVAQHGRPIMVVEEFQGMPARTLVRRLSRSRGGHIVVAVHLVGSACAAADALAGQWEVFQPRHARISGLSQLSATELNVLRLIAQGLTGEQIANAIHRTVKTVEWHRARLGRKLGLKTRVELARFAIRAGLVDLAEPAGVPGENPAPA